MRLRRTDTIGFKLTGAFILMAAIVAVTGIFGILSIDRVVNRVVTMMRTGSAQEKVVLELEMHQKACRVNLVEGAMVLSDPAKFARYVDNYQKKRALFRKNVGILIGGDKKLGIPPASKGGTLEKQAKSVLASWGEFEAVADELIARKTALLKGLKPGVVDLSAMRALADEKLNAMVVGKIMETSENAKQDIDDVADYVDSMMFKTVKESAKIRQRAIITFVTVIVGAVILAIILGAFITRNIVTRLGKIARAFSQGAEGDLTVSVVMETNDELGMLGRDFNVMAERLAGMVAKVNGATDELKAISNDIVSASSKVAAAAHRQAAGVGATSSAVTEINATLKGVSSDADNLALNAEESSASILEMSASIEEVARNMETLSKSVDEVSFSIVEMATTIKEISDSVFSLQDVSVATASSVMEMENSIRSVEQNALETASISRDVQTDAETGKAAVEATIAGINEIRLSSQITFDIISNLSGRANDIGAILSIIDDVAEQTNLLALNAAIIAAQAGEHGKGFAVVSDEIKELAERTSNSTREIATVIKGVQQDVQRAATATNTTEQRIAEGEKLSRRSGDALNKIVTSARRSSDHVGQIARAAAEQARGSRLIRESSEQVSAMVGQIAKATHEQRLGSELIMTAVGKMKELNGQVLNAIREQSKVGGFIARTTTNITGMIQQIRRACGEQSRGSEQIVNAMQDIQDSATVNLEVAQGMNMVVTGLLAQVTTLQGALGNFSIDSNDSLKRLS